MLRINFISMRDIKFFYFYDKIFLCLILLQFVYNFFVIKYNFCYIIKFKKIIIKNYINN